ncbi:MAG: hypothetical protein HY043_21720 [Verrucomicrobia bacterium]|nr:hypothetical protein [Verrucomicrobiota bacterium]
MNELERQLNRLFHWARRAPERETAALPYGFATRVVAQWQAARPELVAALWERLACRAAFAAGLVLLIGAASYFAANWHEVAYDYNLNYSAMEIASVP